MHTDRATHSLWSTLHNCATKKAHNHLHNLTTMRGSPIHVPQLNRGYIQQ